MTQNKTGFLRHIQKLNTWNPDRFRPFIIANQQVGFLKDYMCDLLNQWPEYFDISSQKVLLSNDIKGFNARSNVLDEVVHQLVEQGVIINYLGEPYAVTGHGREPAYAFLDRGAAAYFGIRAYGQHLSGYLKTREGLKLWIARRASDRIHFPNKLDNLVAGGLPHNISLENNLIKECQEEANIPTKLANKAFSTGAITYCCETEIGLKPDTLYCYDLELPESFIPRNTDGEVAEFYLLAVEEVLALVRDTDEFKLNCNLVLLDFFLRHGLLSPDEPDYLDWISGLHG